MVDCSSQVIVAQDLRQEAVDWQLLAPMLSACQKLVGAHPKICIADSGYWSEANAALAVFGQMYERGLNRFLLRGFRKARAEWSLWCTSHNLLKLWRAGLVMQPT